MKAISIIAVVVAGLCTAAFNWQFSYGLGRTEHEALTWAIFSVALDVTKWTMLVIAVRAWPSINALAALVIWIAATSYSFTAALGFAASNRAHQDFVSLQFREHRTALQSAKQAPLWKSTHACTEVTTRNARAYCANLRGLASKSASQPKEAQNTSIASLLNLTEHQASLMLSLYLALTCEIISALGLLAVLSPNHFPERTASWISRMSKRSTRRATTPASSASAGSSTPGLPRSEARQSNSSSNGSWRRPRSWT